MADHTKIHPVNHHHQQEDIEASPQPTVPLVPRGVSKSDESEEVEQYPPFKRTIPVMHSKAPKKRSCLCKCLCWTVTLLLVLILVVAIIAGILFLVFRPKLPKYSIDRLRITQLSLTNNSSLYATSDVTIIARNPNKKIGIYYEGGSHIGVWYTSTKLCQGSIPKFYQGHRNTTVLNVTLTGQTEDANGLLTVLQQQQQQTGFIPLRLRVKQPVRVKLGKLKLMKVKFLVRCRLDVDSLSPNRTINIRNRSCEFKFRL